MRKRIFLSFTLILVICICSVWVNAASVPPYLGMWGKNEKWQGLPKDLQYGEESGANLIMIEKIKDAQIPIFPKNGIELAYYFYDVPQAGSLRIYFLTPSILKSTDNEEHHKLNFYGLVGGIPLMITPKGNAIFKLDTNPELTEIAKKGLYLIACPKGYFFFRIE